MLHTHCAAAPSPCSSTKPCRITHCRSRCTMVSSRSGWLCLGDAGQHQPSASMSWQMQSQTCQNIRPHAPHVNASVSPTLGMHVCQCSLVHHTYRRPALMPHRSATMHACTHATSCPIVIAAWPASASPKPQIPCCHVIRRIACHAILCSCMLSMHAEHQPQRLARSYHGTSRHPTAAMPCLLLLLLRPAHLQLHLACRQRAAQCASDSALPVRR
jgi:hypothetical protein